MSEVLELNREVLEENEKDAKRKLGMVYPNHRAIVHGKGTHFHPHKLFVDFLEKRKTETGSPFMDKKEKERFFMSVYEEAVPLIYQKEDSETDIEIRPDDGIDLALRADRLLQELFPKHHIGFLFASTPKVRNALRAIGECYRLVPPPKTEEEIFQLINASRVGLGSQVRYFYNKETGVRYLTFQEFSKLENLSPQDLRKSLKEIAEYSNSENRQSNNEVMFFMADKIRFDKTRFNGFDYEHCTEEEIISNYRRLREEFKGAVPIEMQADNIQDLKWRSRMVLSLIGRTSELERKALEEEYLGLSAEYFHRVRWLPGAKVDGRELIIDNIYEEREKYPGDKKLEELCGDHCEIVRGIIFNHFRRPDMRGMSSINIGVLPTTLSNRKNRVGRRGIYLAEIEFPSKEKPLVKIIRLQKRGMREFINQGLSQGEACLKATQYNQYTMDRHLACKELGMSLLPDLTTGIVTEHYRNRLIFTHYFERDYIFGEATDKIRKNLFSNQNFANRFFTLLGESAAPNVIVGRVDDLGEVFFDDGDEIIELDKEGMPLKLTVSNYVGSFADYLSSLENFAKAYASPINKRKNYILNKKEAVEAYLTAFKRKFKRMQEDYQENKNAFKSLFRNRESSDVYTDLNVKWLGVLDRLESANPEILANFIEQNIE